MKRLSFLVATALTLALSIVVLPAMSASAAAQQSTPSETYKGLWPQPDPKADKACSDFIEGLKKPGSTGSCCGEGDLVNAYVEYVPVDKYSAEEIWYYKKFGGEKKRVPQNIITQERSPCGGPLLFENSDGVPVCFSPGDVKN